MSDGECQESVTYYLNGPFGNIDPTRVHRLNPRYCEADTFVLSSFLFKSETKEGWGFLFNVNVIMTLLWQLKITVIVLIHDFDCKEVHASECRHCDIRQK